ncbi:MAG: HAD-IC family P-type ATPase [Patescibacteria group bacterium]
MDQKQWQRASTLSNDLLATSYETDLTHGLTDTQAQARLKTVGKNVLSANEQGWWDLLVRQFKSVFIYLLLFAAILSFILGEYIDGVLVLLFISLNVILTFFQEYKSHNILESLKKYFVAKTTIVRDGKEITVMSTELIPGDIVSVKPGDILPADMRFFQTRELAIDESLLTGESEEVEKVADTLTEEPKEIFLAKNSGFAATTVVRGHGMGVVVATRSETVAGSTARLAAETKRVSSFETSMNQFSVFMLRLVVVTLAVLFVLHLIIKGPSLQIGDLLIFFIALAVSVVPEALPVVFTFALSHGASKLAKANVVVKRLTSIEDLGNIEILCTDKTGTITQGEMTVAGTFDQNGSALSVGRQGIPDATQISNPFDQAIIDAAQKTKETTPELTLVETLGFDPKTRLDLSLFKGKKFVVVVRGAPESVMEKCKLSNEDQKTATAWMESEGKKGHRVLGIAMREFDRAPKEWQKADGYVFAGLLSFKDPLKPDAIAAAKKADQLGIQLKIITGDRPEVAGAIAKEVGIIKDAADVVTGAALFAMSAADQLKTVAATAVFARVSPQEKLEIIRLLKIHARVGFLGEGINDAPALKEAHVGIVVANASDVAREAADIVLLEKSLLAILDGVEQGRRVFLNTIKYIKITLASNFGNFYAVIIASLFMPDLPMLPIQLLLVNLLSDFPMIAVAGDTVDAEDLKKPKHMDLRAMGFFTTFFGVVSTIFDLLLFGLFYRMGTAILQTAWFIASIMTELLVILSLRTRRWFFLAQAPSRVLSFFIIGAALATILLPQFAFTRHLFSFAQLSSSHLLMIVAIVVGYLLATELVKQMYERLVHAQVESS